MKPKLCNAEITIDDSHGPLVYLCHRDVRHDGSHETLFTEGRSGSLTLNITWSDDGRQTAPQGRPHAGLYGRIVRDDAVPEGMIVLKSGNSISVAYDPAVKES